MTIKLFFQALTKFVLGVVVVGALLFVPAGTFDYPQAGGTSDCCLCR